MAWVLRHAKTLNEVKVGDTVTDFRGEATMVTDMAPPRNENSTGRVYVEKRSKTPTGGVCVEQGSYYPSVFNLVWKEEDDVEMP